MNYKKKIVITTYQKQLNILQNNDAIISDTFTN